MTDPPPDCPACSSPSPSRIGLPLPFQGGYSKINDINLNRTEAISISRSPHPPAAGPLAPFSGSPPLLWLKSLAYATLTTLAICVQIVPPDTLVGLPLVPWLYAVLKGGVPVGLALCGALLVLYRLVLPLGGRGLPTAAVVAALFSGFLVFGRSYEALDSWDFIAASPRLLLLNLAMGLGYFLLFDALVGAALRWLDTRLHSPTLVPPPRRFAWLYLGCFGLLLLCWLPYLLLCYPGSVTYDGLYQLGQYVGAAPATNHHPWLSTLVMGAVVELGSVFGSTQAGIFCYVLFQSVLCAAAFAWVCTQVRVLAGRLPMVLSLAFFCVVPTWGAYAQMFVKDTLFAGVFTGFYILVVLFLQQRDRPSRAVWLGLLVLGGCCALLRNNGLYTVVPTLLLLAVVAGGTQAKAAVAGMGAGILALHLCVTGVLLPAMGVAPGSVREMLSLPFQQTARYVRDFGHQLTAQEIAAIDQVLDYESLAASYDPRVSDPVKNTYRENGQALGAYFKVWLRCGLKHPDVYVQATLNSMFGYFLPGYRYGSFGGNYFLMQEENYGIHAQFAHPEAVEQIDQLSRLWSRVPGLLLLNAPGTFSWLLIFCSAAMLRRRAWPGLCATFPLWLNLAICCISPVNGLVRYMLPIMATTPLLLAFTLHSLSQPDKGGAPTHG